ncbi:MAG TPA: BamA/TamA family outer membrane protein, partial [Longimicrobiaceae bacterium]|nr:BamA/TamA family outer membrane protein [Longimicrobiaceae bacterium]
PFPSAGYQLRLGTDYASTLIGSEDEYLRVQGDGSVYREIREDWVVQLRLTGGTFLEGLVDVGAGFIPPQRRFYAGGPNTVRGFRRNELGPTVYVRRIDPPPDPDDPPDTLVIASATGGTRMVVGTLEVTAPAPILRETLRMAAFVDGGKVSASDSLAVNPGLRFTPGVGVRYASPVGPLRFDVAFNPYNPEPGPLFEIGPTGTLVGPLGTFQPEPRTFWKRLTLHVSLGQAF